MCLCASYSAKEKEDTVIGYTVWRMLFRDFSVKGPRKIKINTCLCIKCICFVEKKQLEEIWKALEKLGHGFYVH